MAKTISFSPFSYFEYYRNHTQNVVLVWKDIRDFLYEEKIINDTEYEKITNLVIWHDNSKISKEEFNGYGFKFFGSEQTEETKKEFKKAWEHHKENNIHHHQTLKDYKGDDRKCYIIEMLCDWIAMGWETGDLAGDYYLKIRNEISLEKEELILIETIFDLIEKYNLPSSRVPTDKEKTKLIFF